MQFAESKLDDEGRAEKDDLIRRRAEEEARRAAEAEAELQRSWPQSPLLRVKTTTS